MHRIGRTGRAGRKGDAIMLVARLDERNYDDILNLIKTDAIEELVIPGIENFPKDDGSRRRRGRDGGKGRGRRDNRHGGRKHHGQKSDGSYHDNKVSTEKVASTTTRAETPKTESKREAKKPIERRRPAPRRKPAPGRDKPKETEKVAVS